MNPLSGYEDKKVNGGKLQNSGIEVALNTDIFKNENFNWNVNANFSKLKSEVKELYGSISKYPLGGYDNVTFFAEVGKPFGVIYGTKFLRVEDPNNPNFGKLIVGANGLPQATPDQYYLGDQSPRMLFGLTNSFSYKNIIRGRTKSKKEKFYKKPMYRRKAPKGKILYLLLSPIIPLIKVSKSSKRA